MAKPNPLIPAGAIEARRACSRPDGSLDLGKLWVFLHEQHQAEVQDRGTLALERAAGRETAELLARLGRP